MSLLGKRLKELRNKKDLTQEELAQIIQITPQAISHYERGIRNPDHDTLLALCDFFNVSSDYLLGKDGVTPVLIGPDDMIYTGEELNAVLNPEMREMILAYMDSDESTKDAARRVLGLKNRAEAYIKELSKKSE